LRSSDPWPAHVQPDFRNVEVALSRTQPEAADRSELREVETLYLDMIAAARRSIYIENQFVTCINVALGLAAALREQPQLEVLIVMPRTHTSWLGERAMLAGRRRFLEILRSAVPASRVRAVHPQVVAGETAADVMVHSKLMIVDDRLLRIGSANLCNRSMGTDTECDLTIEATDPCDRRAIRAVRDRLLGEHCGVEPEEIGAQIERTGSLFAVLDCFEGRTHRLVDMADMPASGEEMLAPVETLADPERPISIVGLFCTTSSIAPALRRSRTIAKIGIALAMVVLILLLWRHADLNGFAAPGALERLLADFAANPLAPAAVIALFVCAGLLGFPVTVLIAATAVSFGAWPGLPYAAAGSLTSATATYGVGLWLGSGVLRRLLGPRLNRIRRAIARRGVLAITAVRLVPIAPFTLVNLVAGALKVSLMDYLVGTALGLLPGLAAMSLLGDRLGRMLTDPTLVDFGFLLAIVIAWLGLSLGLQALVTRVRRRRR
jgi:phospholipase D1/2